MDEGRLRAWLDGELPESEAEELVARMEKDPSLRRRADELRDLDARTRSLLDRLETPPPPTERVRATVQAARNVSMEVTPDRPAAGVRFIRRSRLAQAAVLLLLLAGAASAAIPGSPVRDWIAAVLNPETPSGLEGERPISETEIRGPDETGIVTAPDDGTIRIELVGLPSGAEIVVRFTEEEGAGVFGPLESQLVLEGEVGRIHARAVAGPIRVELPRGLRAGDLLVDGRVYLSVRDDTLDLGTVPTDSSDHEIRLRVGS